MIGYYDLVLGLIPVTLIGLSGALYGAGFTLTTAVPFGGLVAAGLVGHALFVNAPIGDSSSTTANANPTPGAD